MFVRPGELRAAEWSEFNLDGKEPERRIAGSKMKMGEQHIVPLSHQAVAVIRNSRASRATLDTFAFPSRARSLHEQQHDQRRATPTRYDNTDIVGHGFRAMASTLLNEQGWHPDLIELQLAHAERNEVRAAYKRAERLAERRTMMQASADYLDKLRTATQEPNA